MKSYIPYNAEASSDVRKLSRVFLIPQFILRSWQLTGYISRASVTAEQWETLNMIRCCIWENRNVIRSMLRGLPKAERRRLIDTCEKTTIERIVYNDMLRFKLTGTGIMGDCRPVTYERYQKYLTWRHPNLWHLLTRSIFEKQRKSALAKISYSRKKGLIKQLMNDLSLSTETVSN